MKKYVIILMISIFASTQICFAGTLELTLEQAIKRGIEENEYLKIKRNEAIKKEYEYKESLSPMYPQFSSSFLWSYYPKVPRLKTTMDLGDGPTDIDIPMKKDWEMDLNVTATQLIWAFGRVSKGIKAARKTIEMSKLEQDLSEREIIFNIKQAYFAVLLTQKALEIAKSSYENSKKNKAMLAKGFSFGRASGSDNIKLSADVAGRIPALKESGSQLDLSTKTLKMLLDIGEDEQVLLKDDLSQDFPSYDKENLKKHMHESDPQLKLLTKSFELNQDIVSIRKAEYFPIINAFASWDYMGDGDDFYVGESRLQNVLVTGIQLSFTIWDGGAIHNRYKQAIIDRSNAEISLRKARKELNLDLDKTISEYASLRETFKANQDATKLAQKSYEIMLDKFQSGKVSSTALNDAELMLTAMRIQTLMNLFNINVAIAKIEKITSEVSKG